MELLVLQRVISSAFIAHRHYVFLTICHTFGNGRNYIDCIGWNLVVIKTCGPCCRAQSVKN